MIFDRTQADVDEAKRVLDEYFKPGVELDFSGTGGYTVRDLHEWIEKVERGCLTDNTLNRIEDKQAELQNLFNDLGYFSQPFTNKTWETGDVFTVDDFQRIIDNENTLRKAFFVYNDTPDTPDISFHYSDINALEKILNDLDIMINDVKSNYRECGAYYCGGD